MFEYNLDGWFGRTRICKYCETPTQFDKKIGRYCPKGCFKGNHLNKFISYINRLLRRYKEVSSHSSTH
ncbi:hypothetical protein LCGC14_0694090 [marine sediment metagenome]|uniref:Uncharacterized protein n=1 Tax=marine sediment metagenome TaxID=412755 RepID=A0A0F9R4W2_9ZZZZ